MKVKIFSLIFLISITFYNCCPIKTIEAETVNKIKITLEPIKPLREKPFSFFLDRDEIQILIKIINNSTCTSVQGIKSITEGQYLIEIFHLNNVVDRIFMAGANVYIWRNKKQIIKNSELLRYVRNLLFLNLQKQGIRLD